MSKNIKDLSYAKFLEKTLQELVGLPVKGIALNAVLKNGEVYTAYHEVTMADKLVISGIVQQDAMLDTLAANGYVEYADDESDGEAQTAN